MFSVFLNFYYNATTSEELKKWILADKFLQEELCQLAKIFVNILTDPENRYCLRACLHQHDRFLS